MPGSKRFNIPSVRRAKRSTSSVVVAIAAVIILNSVAQARKWSDVTGKFSTEADLIEVKEENALLKKPNGDIVSVPLGKLSNADRKFIQERSKRATGGAGNDPNPAPNIPNGDPKVANSNHGVPFGQWRSDNAEVDLRPDRRCFLWINGRMQAGHGFTITEHAAIKGFLKLESGGMSVNVRLSDDGESLICKGQPRDVVLPRTAYWQGDVKPESGKPNGEWICWWQGGKTRKEAGEFSDGERIGVWTKWNEAGNKTEEATLEKGVLEGVTKTWSDDGKLRSEVEYKAGKANGTVRRWNESNELVTDCEYRDGKPFSGREETREFNANAKTERRVQKVYRAGKLVKETNAGNDDRVEPKDLPGPKRPLWRNMGKGESSLVGADVGIDHTNLHPEKPPKSRTIPPTKKLQFALLFRQKPTADRIEIDVSNQSGHVDVQWNSLAAIVEDFTTGQFYYGIGCDAEESGFEAGSYQAKVSVGGKPIALLNWGIGNAKP